MAEAVATARALRKSGTAVLALSALGVVFGDIGTSPLYTFKTVLNLAGAKPDAAMILGSVSLIFWTLILITSLKYVNVAMRVDNDGEGGILALMALLGIKRQRRPVMVALGLFGAALIYGDGAITPAISVLSALEGLNIAWPSFQAYVVPASVAILVVLFVLQPQGTARIGRAFGPVMALWFAVIGLLGLWGIARHPGVLRALDPIYGLRFLFSNHAASFLVLGGVFLCVTGAEALYADMGHFGPSPIRRAWSLLVMPSLLLNYAGQAAIVLEGAPTTDNIFFRLAPSAMLVPLVVLSTIATIIASQSIITGAFSMTRQAIQLGWLPRVEIRQTSSEGYGQIYVGAVNWMLMVVTVGLTVSFQKSDNLAAAYGIAVSATMLMTSGLLFIAMREVLHWPVAVAVVLASLFVVVDGAFVLANFAKFLEGGYVPIILALAVYGTMWIWHLGRMTVVRTAESRVVPVSEFLQQLGGQKIARVPGTAVFLTRTQRETPPVMVWHVERNRALHEQLLVLTVKTAQIPWVHQRDRLTLEELGPQFYRGCACYGFMERPDIPALLREAKSLGCSIDLSDVTYYVGHETIVPKEDKPRLPRFVEALFALMQRNSAHLTDYCRLPREAVVELGREVAV